MEQWKKAMSQGNTAFNEGLDDVAIRHYTAACQRACLLLPHWAGTEEAIVALVIVQRRVLEPFWADFDGSHPTSKRYSLI